MGVGWKGFGMDLWWAWGFDDFTFFLNLILGFSPNRFSSVKIWSIGIFGFIIQIFLNASVMVKIYASKFVYGNSTVLNFDDP